LAYYSNMGSISSPTNQHLLVEKVLIMIHGSDRNADEYFCTALSLIPKNDDGKVLVLAPKFASPEDTKELPSDENFLIWQDHGEDLLISHSWRYGADAMNAPISSYAALDRLVEFLVQARRVQFPNLSQISLAGHSAGGQVTHRWALLSSYDDDDVVEIRAIVANPRSYCYLDNRRIVADNYVVPDAHDVALCTHYNKWQWGLEAGGNLISPYKDEALKETPAERMAERYATRTVIYLSGQYDTLHQIDRCATSFFQGTTRKERAEYYQQALQSYFQRDSVHQFHVVPQSPHDHSLMFQSDVGRNAIFGTNDEESIIGAE
jgi:pimeloyl-ACP methyl ester carboxylesterase